QPGGARLAGGTDRRGRSDRFPRPGGLRPRGPAAALPLAVRTSVLADPPGPLRRPVRRIPRRLLGVPGRAPAAVLHPARVRRLPRPPRLADRAGHPGLGQRPGPDPRDPRGPAPGDRRALPAVLADPIRLGGPAFGPVLAAGDPRAVPPRPMGLRLLADD